MGYVPLLRSWSAWRGGIPCCASARPDHDNQVRTKGEEEVNVMLSKRQLQILIAASNGVCSKEFGAKHGIAKVTADEHVQAAMIKLGARNRTHAVAEAIRRGLIE